MNSVPHLLLPQRKETASSGSGLAAAAAATEVEAGRSGIRFEPDSIVVSTDKARSVRLLKARLQDPAPRVMGFGHAPLEAAFTGGGLAAGAHQAAGEGASLLGFGLALVVRALMERPHGRALLIEAADAGRETGFAYAPGLQAMGLDPDRLGVARVRSEAEGLRVVDEALRSGAVAAVLANLGRASRLDLSVTRRFNLSARRAGALAVLATPDLEATSAALTRWRVEPGPSHDRRRRLGRSVFRLHLLRNRLGSLGSWTLEWDSDDRLFRPVPSLSAPLARPSVDRPDPAARPEPGLAPGAYRQAV